MKTRFLIPTENFTSLLEEEELKNLLETELKEYGMEYKEDDGGSFNKTFDKKIKLKKGDKVYFHGCLEVVEKYLFIDEDIIEYILKIE